MSAAIPVGLWHPRQPRIMMRRRHSPVFAFSFGCEPMRRRNISLVNRPLGWIVHTVESPGGLLLYWFRPSFAPLRRIACAAPCFAAAPLAAFDFQANILSVLGMAAIALLLLWWLIQWLTCKIRVPEAVFLGPDWMAYYPGSEVRDVRVIPLLPLGSPSAVDPEKIITLAVQQLTGIVLERGELARSLFITSDNLRQEIGACLVPSERDWLFDVLQQWRQGIDKRGAR